MLLLDVWWRARGAGSPLCVMSDKKLHNCDSNGIQEAEKIEFK